MVKNTKLHSAVQYVGEAKVNTDVSTVALLATVAGIPSLTAAEGE